jgi:hypothetical protein
VFDHSGSGRLLASGRLSWEKLVLSTRESLFEEAHMGTRFVARVGMVAVTAFLWAGAADAAPIFWTDWLGTNSGAVNGTFVAQGTITTPTSTVNVTYTNPQGIGFYQATSGTDWWTDSSHVTRDPLTSPYTSSAVDNIPTGVDMIGLDKAGTQTLQFSQTIANPVFSFISLNANGYGFLNQDFQIVSLGGVDGNNCGWWGCGGATKQVIDLGGGNFEYRLVATNVGGTEPHGTIRFLGAFDTLVWSSLTNEYWNGITVGVQGTADEVFPEPVPEPSTLLLVGAGLLSAVASRYRRTARSAR